MVSSQPGAVFIRTAITAKASDVRYDAVICGVGTLVAVTRMHDIGMILVTQIDDVGKAVPALRVPQTICKILLVQRSIRGRAIPIRI
jgi:hypothetical protein